MSVILESISVLKAVRIGFLLGFPTWFQINSMQHKIGPSSLSLQSGCPKAKTISGTSNSSIAVQPDMTPCTDSAPLPGIEGMSTYVVCCGTGSDLSYIPSTRTDGHPKEKK